MRLTAERLREAGACGRGIEGFLQVFPHGVVVTARAVRTAAEAGLDVDWAVQMGLVPARLAVEAGLRPKSPAAALAWGRQLGPGDVTRAAACRNPWVALAYALDVDRGPHPATRAAACRVHWTAYLYAREVDRGPHPATRAAACRDPAAALFYAREVEPLASE